MNSFERDFTGEAKLEYGDSDFMILEPGAYVLCAVTGVKIQLNQVRYWSAEHQEAYADAKAATTRFMQTASEPGAKG
jgi:hypothetical protein